MSSESTPLLNNVEHAAGVAADCETAAPTESVPNPLPKLQLGIVFLVLLSEPITASVIYPFLFKLVGEVGITDDPKATGYYVGLIVRSPCVRSFRN